MHLPIIAVVGSLVLIGEQQVNAQGTFRNLDFESAIPPFNPDLFGYVPITNALPGWVGYINGGPFYGVVYNSINLSGPSISLVDSKWPSIQGSYSVLLKTFSDTGGTSAAIGQTGQVPNGAVSLFFLSSGGLGSFDVSFAGQNIPLVQYGTSGNNFIMAGDISSFAGQTGELRFLGTGIFDNIQFSDLSIPEPSASALLGFGVVGLGLWLNKRRKEWMLLTTKPI